MSGQTVEIRFAREAVAAYVHRIALRRAWAGRGVPRVLLAWCAQQAQALGCGYLRLDCDAERLKLRELYEGLKFRCHSERNVGRHTVARFERTVQWEGAREAALGTVPGVEVGCGAA